MRNELWKLYAIWFLQHLSATTFIGFLAVWPNCWPFKTCGSKIPAVLPLSSDRDPALVRTKVQRAFRVHPTWSLSRPLRSSVSIKVPYYYGPLSLSMYIYIYSLSLYVYIYIHNTNIYTFMQTMYAYLLCLYNLLINAETIDPVWMMVTFLQSCLWLH